jgi:hypothetical protein
MAPRWQAAKVQECSACSSTSAQSSVVKAMAVQRTRPAARPSAIRPQTPSRGQEPAAEQHEHDLDGNALGPQKH